MGVAAPLRQQELEPPAPVRHVAAPDGSWWAGVDPSTLRVSLAAVWPQDMELGPRVVTERFRPCREGERLDHIYAATRKLAVDVVERWGPPGVTWVEQPFSFGHPVPPVSYMVEGVIMAALFSVFGTPVESVGPPGFWKARSVGNGNAKKAQVLEWAELSCGYSGSLQDEADALGLAVAASRTVGFLAEVAGTAR